MKCLIVTSSNGLKMLLLSVSFVQKSVLSYEIELPVTHKIYEIVFASMILKIA
uniref:Uncharacterized protein n=1 Tax=Amphimedon queenslandica TaxID=400682 RepID=A0A1X7VKL0_AMPQE